MEKYDFLHNYTSDLQHCVEYHLFICLTALDEIFKMENISIFASIFSMLVFKQIIGLFEGILSVQDVRLFVFFVILLSFASVDE